MRVQYSLSFIYYELLVLCIRVYSTNLTLCNQCLLTVLLECIDLILDQYALCWHSMPAHYMLIVYPGILVIDAGSPIADTGDRKERVTVTVIGVLDDPSVILTTTSIYPDDSEPLNCPDVNPTTNTSMSTMHKYAYQQSQ